MEPNSLKWVGSSCGLHGPYIFYKAFKFASRAGDAEVRILSLGDFFLVRCKPDEPVCVAELQLLWEERTSRQLLSSSKLYFLPEDTPQGRGVSHGEHEVIAVSEKVIVRLQDLVKWTVPDFSQWAHGLKAETLKASVLRELGTNGRREALHRFRESTITSGLNFKDVQRERARLGQEEDGRKVLVLSYPQYCRYRAMLVRLREQPSSLFLNHTVLALGGIAALGANTRILYCRDTFEHPTLLRNESICDHFAPNLKGRPRKKKLSISHRRESTGCTPLTPQDHNSPDTKSHKVKANCRALANGKLSAGKLSSAPKHRAGGGLGRKAAASEEKERVKEMLEERSEKEDARDWSSSEEEAASAEAASSAASSCEDSREDEQAFLVELYKYMKKRDTPIERIPFLGFKQINLWTMFQAAQKLGGYELITVRRQWKHVYDELGGNPSSTSAATCTRRHYERLLLAYERHLKGEQDKPLPLSKPRSQEKAPSAAKAKSVGAKKAKGPNAAKQASRKERSGSGEKGQQQSQDPKVKEETATKLDVDEPIVIEEEELHVTLKKEESLAGEPPTPPCPKESDPGRAPLAPLPLCAGVVPEWRQMGPPSLQAAETEVHPLAKSGYLPHRWDHNKPAGHVALPECKDSSESHGGRVGKVLPMCKQDRRSVDSSADPFPEKDDYGPNRKESPALQMAAYCKGVMSPLAKKKLLSQESVSFSLASSRDADKRKGEDDGARQRAASDGLPETAPMFRPSVIQHAQSSKPPQERSAGAVTQPHVGAPWQPYLRDRDAAESASETLAPVRAFAGDCYSSPHLHSLYRQTENCLGQDGMAAYANGERRDNFARDREAGRAFLCGGLAYRSHYGDQSQTGGESGEAEDEPRDFTVPKPLARRVPAFCGFPYPVVHPGLDSHPKACRVPPMTVSPPKRDPSPPFPSPKSSDSVLASPARTGKRNLGEAECEDAAPERKVRVVTPIHPPSAARRGDPEELKAAEPAHAGTTAYPLPHAAPLYAGMYPPGGLLPQDGLQQHPGLQYLKSQSAVSPLVPPLAFHSMMFHRQLLASAPAPHHFLRHPGGAALYGDLLHHLYPLSTLPPPQLSSVHPSTRL
ncbi:aT-rich interactive domain-containing protein 5B [Festucalex cinctus]